MAKVFEGQLIATGKKFGIVVGRFNEFISSKLLFMDFNLLMLANFCFLIRAIAEKISLFYDRK